MTDEDNEANFVFLKEGYSIFYYLMLWSSVSGLMRFRDASNTGTAMMQSSFPRLSLVMTAGFMVKILRQSNNPLTHSPRPKKVRQVKSKVKDLLIIFFDTKGIIRKEFTMAGQTVNSAYYCDALRRLRKMCEDFAPNFDNKITGYCITTTHCLTLLFHQGIFYQKKYDFRLPLALLA
jgi:hypothetical protein